MFFICNEGGVIRVNKYQKKLHKEIKDLLKVSPNGNYRGARKHLKRAIRHSYEPSPCSDCWSGCDREKKNKIVFCIDRD